MAGLLFWLSLATVIYVYAGYPVIIAALSLFYRRDKNSHSYLPHDLPQVTLLICAYNEQAVIADKLENSLKLDYPKHRLQILVAADGSSDKTAQIVSSFAARGVELSFSHRRLGKMAAINRAMPLARGDIIIFSDANNFYDSDAAWKLTAPFQDASVGGVSGAKTVLRSKGSVGESEGLYWRYEANLAKMETFLGCCCSVAGEIWAIRKHLWLTCPDDIINDDAFMALRLIKMGYRLIYVPDALSSEQPSQSLQVEFQRRARIIAGRYQLMAKACQLIPFHRPFVAWQIISHKFMRPLVPFAMIGALAANLTAVIVPMDSHNSLLLLSWPYNWIMLTLQFIFYASACLGGRLKDIPVFGRMFYLPKFLVVSNYSALVGLMRFIQRRQSTQWEKAQHSSAAIAKGHDEGSG